MSVVVQRQRRVEPELAPLAWERCEPIEILKRIQHANIVGMGGAGFPTHLKLQQVAKHAQPSLIANGIECDPGVSADQSLLRDHGGDVLTGMRIVSKCTAAKTNILAVRDQETFKILQLLDRDGIELKRVSGHESSGEERTLIQHLLGMHIPRSTYPTSCGIIVLNVATLFAITEAVRDGYLPTDRIISSFQGDSWVCVGSRIAELAGVPTQVRLGGVGTSFPAATDTHIKLTTNAVCEDKTAEATACIRCGWCSQVCPRDLNAELLWRTPFTEKMTDSLQQQYLDCVECGACVVACPSKIPILDAIRQRKDEVLQLRTATRTATNAQERFERRTSRLQSAEDAKEESRENRMKQTRIWR